MAKSHDNDLTIGLRGRLGKMISFRRRGDDTEAFRRPGKRTGESTPAQEAHKLVFIDASRYAKAAIADPATKAMYQEKTNGKNSAYNLAMADFMKAPVIPSITVDQYLGQPGNPIIIRAVDDFKVTAVKVVISSEDGNLIERGDAVAEPGGSDWRYTATTVNPRVDGSVVSATASDRPGNHTTKEARL